jgi:hypothetical protein
VVSGNVVFLPTLFLFLTLGAYSLMRFHLCWEQQSNGMYQAGAHSAGDEADSARNRRNYYPAIGGMLTLCLLAGAATFIFCPRLSGGMLATISNSGGGQAITGVDRSLRLHTGGPIKESFLPAFRVQFQVGEHPPRSVSDQMLYFRCETADRYTRTNPNTFKSDGWEWRSERKFVSLEFSEENDEPHLLKLLPKFQFDDPQASLVQHYWLENKPASGLPMLYPAAAVKSTDFKKLQKKLGGQVLQLDEASDKSGLRYSVWTPRVRSRELLEQLERERRNRDEEVFRPSSSTVPRAAEIKELALRIGNASGNPGQAGNRREFARHIEHFLTSDEFDYSLNPPKIPSGTEPVGAFLLDHRQGHCEYFASAMVLMCQLNGIPARLVSGYKGGDYNSLGKFYVVREKHAHAWVEVFIPGEAWVRFDPTPSSGRPSSSRNGFLAGVKNYVDFLQFYWASQVMSYDNATRRELLTSFQDWILRPTRDEKTVVGAVAAFVNELFGGELKMSFKERAIYWIFSLLVLIIVVMVTYALILILRHLTDYFTRYYRAHHQVRHRPAEADFYYRFCRLLAESGWKRHPDQTPAEFARWLSAQSEYFNLAPELVQAYYNVVFGGRSLSRDQQSRFETYIRNLQEYLHSTSKSAAR